ncbi:MAG: hypothetical protein D6815_02000, partial [Candidatus Dadabacteria bacterium]
AVDLDGLTITDDGANSFVIAGPLPVAPGQYVILGRSAEAAGGRVDYVYGSAMSLNNSADRIIVRRGTTVIDEVAYDSRSFPIEAGKATVLAANRQDPLANDDGSLWCASSQPMAGGDSGSPGGPATDCSR